MEVCIFVEPHLGATYDELVALAQLAEEVGFDGFFRSDHFYSPQHRSGDSPTDAWITLAGLARETARIRLGTMVTAATFRHPGVLAIQAAQVDAMSGGRVELGLGAAWMAAEHEAFGIPFPATAGERLDRLEEQLQLITGIYAAGGGPYAFTGKHFSLADYDYRPHPTQARLPVIVGGVGRRRTPLLAARYADELNVPFQDPETFADRMRAGDRACREVGRDPATLKRSAALTTVSGGTDADVDARLVSLGLSREHPQLCGPPEQVVEQAGAYGVDRVYLQLLDLTDLDHVRLLGAEVLPHLR